jgi:hypothetical protein
MLKGELWRDLSKMLIKKIEDGRAPMWLRAAAATVLVLWAIAIICMVMFVMVIIGLFVVEAFILHWLLGVIASLALLYGTVLF